MTTTQPAAIAAVPNFITKWIAILPTVSIASAIGNPEATALFSADLTIGFCRSGNLASARVGALATPAAALFRRAHERGVRAFVLLQDTHDPATPEFDAWPVHCVRGTEESETIPELRDLPFTNSMTVIEKNSLNPAISTGFDAWLDRHPEIRTAIVVGDCTDLCVYQLAMHLRLRANARNIDGFEVIVPANVVDTYDLPLEAANSAFAHPGDFFHQVFLYHLGLNGIRVVAAIE